LIRLRRPYRRAPDLTRRELLDLLHTLARNIEVSHKHVIRHEPIPPPVSASVIFKRTDGSESYRYSINCGRGAYTRFQVPMYALDPAASQSQFIDMEFQWDR